MQEIASQWRQIELAYPQLPRCAVQRVAHLRMLQRGEMHSNLMRTSGMELDFHQRCVVDLCERFPIRARLARIGDGRTMPRFALRRHARSMNRVASDCQINAAAFLRK